VTLSTQPHLTRWQTPVHLSWTSLTGGGTLLKPEAKWTVRQTYLSAGCAFAQIG
jgi:hypothetical protein